jgi:hypothetical protein
MLINFREGVKRDAPVPYLDSIIEPLKLLSTSGRTQNSQNDIQEQAITMLAINTDATEAAISLAGLRSMYIMPLFLHVVRNANRADC